MCVSIIMVLRDVIKVEQEREDLWVWSYVDLLRRFQLWTVATEIVNRSDTASIRAQSQVGRAIVVFFSPSPSTHPSHTLLSTRNQQQSILHALIANDCEYLQSCQK